MKRKTLTIISIVFIIVISLMLLGITYGFFVTQISGNENTKSIIVVSGESKARFTDLSESATSEIIEPGYEYVKSFTVENIGNVKAVYSVYLVDVINTFNRKEDITYELYKIKGEVADKITINTDFSSYIKVAEGTFPNSVTSIASNEVIETQNDIYTYVLKITYIYSKKNQNEDQGKIFGASVNIRALDNDTNPYSEGTLAYSIIDRAKSITESDSKTNGFAMYSETLRTTPGQQISEADESLLLITEDDYGTSYYYRGNVKDNFVNYSGMCWRILRIQGNGTIKLVLYDENNECADNPTNSPSTWINNATSYVYNTVDTTADSSLWPQSLKYESSKIPSILEAWMNDKNFDTSKLTNTDFCNDMSPTTLDNGQITYGALNRLYPTSTASPSLVCSREEDKVNTFIALLTADEVAFASNMDGNWSGDDIGFLSNFSNPMGVDGQISSTFYWTMSPAYYNPKLYYESGNESYWINGGPMMYQIYEAIEAVGEKQILVGYNHSSGIESGGWIRPVISLKSSVTLSTSATKIQNGTFDNPYVIE